MEDAGVQRGIWDGDAKTVQQCLTDIFTSVYTTCDIPENAIFGPCVLSHTSLYDSIAFIALKSTDKRTVPYIFRVRASRPRAQPLTTSAGARTRPRRGAQVGPGSPRRREAVPEGRAAPQPPLLLLPGPVLLVGQSVFRSGGLITAGFQVDTSAANGSSEGLMWLRLVQSAREREEQNLEAYIKSGQLFYRSLRRIAKDEELLVWYGKELTELLLLGPARAPARTNGGCPRREEGGGSLPPGGIGRRRGASGSPAPDPQTLGGHPVGGPG